MAGNMSLAAAIQTPALIVLVWFSGAMERLVSAYPVPHRHSMTLHSTYRCHRRKLVTWYSFTPLIILERMSPMWESMQETTECITLATLLDMQI